MRIPDNLLPLVTVMSVGDTGGTFPVVKGTLEIVEEHYEENYIFKIDDEDLDGLKYIVPAFKVTGAAYRDDATDSD